MKGMDPALQAQVDAQLMEQGAYSPLDLLINTGRLMASDYESWRRREVELLDSVFMGSKDKVRAQIEQAAGYARSIGLVEQAQEFDAWHSEARGGNGKSLRISADGALHRLIAARYVPAQSVPQMDLFFDNPVVALTNGIVTALSARNPGEVRRQLDQLYAQAPNHADLGAFDRLLAALDRLDRPRDDPRDEAEFLLEITPIAKRLLGPRSRDLLAPLWRQLADALQGRAFSAMEPTLHRSFALSQAQDWSGASDSVLGEAGWWLHEPLCLSLAQSSFYCQRRIEVLTAWCHLCWRHPVRAAAVLDSGRHPDSGITALWRRFLDSEDDDAPDGANLPASLTTPDFPAWMLLNESGLALHLAEGLAVGNTPGEDHYRCVHRWIHARRAHREDEEIALRRTLQAGHPALFEILKRLPRYRAGSP